MVQDHDRHQGGDHGNKKSEGTAAPNVRSFRRQIEENLLVTSVTSGRAGLRLRELNAVFGVWGATEQYGTRSITVPLLPKPQNRVEHVVKFVERHLIRDRDQADDHRAHLAQNRSQNQAFEGGCFNHLSRLLGSPAPDFLALSL